MEGEDFSLRCSAEGIPKPTVSWIFNNSSLNIGEDYGKNSITSFFAMKYLADKNGQAVFMSILPISDDLLLMNDNTLVIISARANSSGLYTCIAQNEVGKDQQQTSIEVFGKLNLYSDFLK